MKSLNKQLDTQGVFSSARIMLNTELFLNKFLLKSGMTYSVRVVILFKEKIIQLYTDSAINRIQILSNMPKIKQQLIKYSADLSSYQFVCKIKPDVFSI